MRQNYKQILIIGGTGTIGSCLSKVLSINNSVTIFSRDESLQVSMKLNNPSLNFIIGDIRDADEINKACIKKDFVYNFAAIKHIDICEKFIQESIKTNILGTMNVVNACLNSQSKLIHMSSDKAIKPASVYGMTKSLGEKIVLSVGFSCVRSGNVIGSSGSVFPIWKRQLEEFNQVKITSWEMTRFFIQPYDLIEFIISISEEPSAIYTVPMKSYNLGELAEFFIAKYGGENSKIVEVGLRPGERCHEFRTEEVSSRAIVSHDFDYIFND